MGCLTMMPITNVKIPSMRNNQNHPGFPAVPRSSRIPAAKSAEITRATLRVDQNAASRMDSSLEV